MATYQIYELSARAVMSYAAEQDGIYTFALNRSATEHCKAPGAKHEQDSCAMFHQLIYQLRGKGWREHSEEKVTALSDVLFYMDFAGIFDRRGTGKTQQARREKARDMFRPDDLPDGWDHSPEDDPRQWLTKATETAYYNFRANEIYQQEYFRRGLSQPKGSRANIMARVLEKNPKFIREPIYAEQLYGQARKILRGYAVGRLLVPGDNRFLSGDLLELLRQLIAPRVIQMPGERDFCNQVLGDSFAEDSFFAPGAAYDHEDSCTLLRNPHIARNEELQLSVYPGGDGLRQHYLGHLTDVVMVSADSLAAERLGGADYDGDLIKTIADPILNRCVKRNYDYDVHQQLSNNANLPLLKIPALAAPKSDANDWQARFQTVENTFAARIGQICNAALDRSVIAYNEHADPEERKRCRRDLEALAIYSGLEIDAAKTGVRPNLDEFLGGRKVKRTPFLQYKYLVERLPWLARQLERNTPKRQEKPAKDSALFVFAQDRGWKRHLDANILSSISALLWDYEHCLSRIRACRAPAKGQQRKTDIDRILYARGQEELYDSDELYAFFQQISLERIAALRKVIVEQQWHLANKPEDCDWVVLPVVNFDVYFGTTSFGRKYLKQIPETILERSETGFGLCRYRLGEAIVIE